MANYDDIFNASAQKGTEDKSFVSFNKEEWAAQKKQERESAFAMIDETAQRMANDGSLFQSYLDVQARFDRYSVGNAVLITAQKADATQLSDFKAGRITVCSSKRAKAESYCWSPARNTPRRTAPWCQLQLQKGIRHFPDDRKDQGPPHNEAGRAAASESHHPQCTLPHRDQSKAAGEHQRVYRPDDKKIYVRPGLEPETFSAAFPRSLLTRIWIAVRISAATMPLPPTACHMCSAAGTMCQRICSALTDFPKDSLRWMPAV